MFHAGRIIQTGSKLTKFQGIQKLRNALPNKLKRLVPRLKRKPRVSKPAPPKKKVEDKISPENRTTTGSKGTKNRGVGSKGVPLKIPIKLISPKDMVNKVINLFPFLRQSEKGRKFIDRLYNMVETMENGIKQGKSINSIRERIKIFGTSVHKGNWFQFIELPNKFGKRYLDFTFNWTIQLGKREFLILDGKLGNHLISVAVGSPKQIMQKYQEMMGIIIKERGSRILVRTNSMNFGDFDIPNNKFVKMISELEVLGELQPNLNLRTKDEFILNNNRLIAPKFNNKDLTSLKEEFRKDFFVDLGSKTEIIKASNMDPWTKRFFVNQLNIKPNITVDEMLDELMAQKFLMIE